MKLKSFLIFLGTSLALLNFNVLASELDIDGEKESLLAVKQDEQIVYQARPTSVTPKRKIVEDELEEENRGVVAKKVRKSVSISKTKEKVTKTKSKATSKSKVRRRDSEPDESIDAISPSLTLPVTSAPAKKGKEASPTNPPKKQLSQPRLLKKPRTTSSLDKEESRATSDKEKSPDDASRASSQALSSPVKTKATTARLKKSSPKVTKGPINNFFTPKPKESAAVSSPSSVPSTPQKESEKKSQASLKSHKFPSAKGVTPVGAKKGSAKKVIDKKPQHDRLTAFFIEGKVDDFDAVLRESDRELILEEDKEEEGKGKKASVVGIEKYFIKEGTGVIYIKSEFTKTPAWASIARNYLKDEEHKTITFLGQHKRETGQVILLQREQGIIGFIFGQQGRHMVQSDLLKSDFGRRVAFNHMAAKGESIRGGSLFIPGANTTRKNISYTHATNLTTLSKSEDGGFIRALVRKDVSFSGSKISYKKSLDINTLPDLSDELLEWYAKLDYQAFERDADYFPVFNNKDENSLNEKLFTTKKWGFTWPHWLADNFDEGEVVYATLSSSDKTYPTMGDLFRELREKSKKANTVKALKGLKINVYGEEDQLLAGWNAYQVLSFETVYKENDYVLNSGQWFRLQKDLNKKITAAMKQHLLLPENQFKGHKLLVHLTSVTSDDIRRAKEAKKKASKETKGNYLEDIYNRRVVNESKGSFLLMDRRLVKATPTDSHSDIELCDILTGEKDFVCVKDGHASASLSHLWTQGVNAAKVLKAEHEFALRALEVYIRFELIDMLLPHYEKFYDENKNKIKEEDRKKLDEARTTRLRGASHEVRFDSRTLTGGGYDEALRNKLIATALTLPPFKKLKKEEKAELKLEWGKVITDHQLKFREFLPPGPVNPADYTIIYGIFQDEGKDFHLPFFSRLGLYSAARELERDDFKWAVIKINRPSRSTQKTLTLAKNSKVVAPTDGSLPEPSSALSQVSGSNFSDEFSSINEEDNEDEDFVTSENGGDDALSPSDGFGSVTQDEEEYEEKEDKESKKKGKPWVPGKDGFLKMTASSNTPLITEAGKKLYEYFQSGGGNNCALYCLGFKNRVAALHLLHESAGDLEIRKLIIPEILADLGERVLAEEERKTEEERDNGNKVTKKVGKKVNGKSLKKPQDPASFASHFIATSAKYKTLNDQVEKTKLALHHEIQRLRNEKKSEFSETPSQEELEKKFKVEDLVTYHELRENKSQADVALEAYLSSESVFKGFITRTLQGYKMVSYLPGYEEARYAGATSIISALARASGCNLIIYAKNFADRLAIAHQYIWDSSKLTRILLHTNYKDEDEEYILGGVPGEINNNKWNHFNLLHEEAETQIREIKAPVSVSLDSFSYSLSSSSEAPETSVSESSLSLPITSKSSGSSNPSSSSEVGTSLGDEREKENEGEKNSGKVSEDNEKEEKIGREQSKDTHQKKDGASNAKKYFSPNQKQVACIVKYWYEKNEKNKAKTAKDLNVSKQSVLKLIENKAPNIWKKVAKKFNTLEKIRKFSGNHTDAILALLSKK